MSKTITFGAFITSATEDRLTEAQRVADELGVTITADGSPFAGSGHGAPVKVTVIVPDGAVVTTENIMVGRDALDAILTDGERLTDYALVKDDGVLTEVVSLLTAESKVVGARTPVSVPAAEIQRRKGPRWSPFNR